VNRQRPPMHVVLAWVCNAMKTQYIFQHLLDSYSLSRPTPQHQHLLKLNSNPLSDPYAKPCTRKVGSRHETSVLAFSGGRDERDPTCDKSIFVKLLEKVLEASRCPWGSPSDRHGGAPTVDRLHALPTTSNRIVAHGRPGSAVHLIRHSTSRMRVRRRD
jgi:hypothetical protein